MYCTPSSSKSSLAEEHSLFLESTLTPAFKWSYRWKARQWYWIFTHSWHPVVLSLCPILISLPVWLQVSCGFIQGDGYIPSCSCSCPVLSTEQLQKYTVHFWALQSHFDRWKKNYNTVSNALQPDHSLVSIVAVVLSLYAFWYKSLS